MAYFPLFSQFASSFQNAYQSFPNIPKGFLEAVSFQNTRCQNIGPNELQSCSGIPLPYGIMGLFDDGGNYFIENGKRIGKLSGISVGEQKQSIDLQVFSYAKAADSLLKIWGNIPLDIAKSDPRIIYDLMYELGAIPQNNLNNLYAFQSSVYEVLRFLNDENYAAQFSFVPYDYNLRSFFGNENFEVLSGRLVIFDNQKIRTKEGVLFAPQVLNYKSINYSPALWTAAPSCNYSSRNGIAVSAVTIHTIQGTYSGAISWAQNCNSSVSYHYVVRSSDGQITQMVLESNKAWHVGSENGYTIGIEHEGYVSNPTWYTPSLYQGSANLCKDITLSGYGISPFRTYDGSSSSGSQVLGNCVKIKGHQHYPNQTHTDPGIYWNWDGFYRLINDTYTPILIENPQGDLYDSGGANGNYTAEERTVWLIQPNISGTISLSFDSFNTESGYDKLLIYDGNSTNSVLLGVYSGNSIPPNILSSTSALTLEFRSDCAVNTSGWHASYTTIPMNQDTTAPNCQITNQNNWNSQDMIVDLMVSDSESGVQGSFYNVSDRNGANSSFTSNDNYGFLRDEFTSNNNLWTNQSGLFQVNNGVFTMMDDSQNNSNAYSQLVQNNSGSYLYSWKQKINSSLSNQRAGMHFFCSDPTLPNRGNSYFVYFREETDKVQIYKVTNDVFQLEYEDNATFIPGNWYQVQVLYNPQNGKIKVYLNESLCATWIDSSPWLNGSAVSFRSGGCSVSFDDVFVYKNHTPQQLISIGGYQEIRYQSDHQNPSGELRLIAVDSVENWSQSVSQFIQVDWTKPEVLSFNDGLNWDIDTVSNTLISSNWVVIDPHSEINNIEIGLGSAPLLNSELSWTNVGVSSMYQFNITSPNYGADYYFNLHAINNAGLDTVLSTDGQLLLNNSGAGLQGNLLTEIEIYPNPNHENILNIKNVYGPVIISFLDLNGRTVLKKEISHDDTLNFSLESGMYELLFNDGKQVFSKKLIVY